MRAAVAAVVLVTVGALATGADAADGEGQPHRRRRRDSSDLQQQMQARGLPFEGLSPVQMQEALAADSAAATGDSGADKDSNNCPAGSVFDQAERHEYCVVGAGPGGLQMAAFLHSAQRDYVVFERAPEAASFYKRYPRHRKLISINKRNTGRNNAEFNWRHDWNSLLSPESGPAADAPRFAEFSRDYFPDADTWVDYAANYSQGLNINYRTDVVKVSRAAKSRGGDFVLRTNSPEQDGKHIRCQTLIIATSLPKAYAPPIEGLLENSIGYDEDEFSVNKEDYENKTVLILGKKQSAMETAKHIYGHTAELHIVSPSRARIAWESHYVGDIRAVNAEVLDAYQLKSLDSIIDADLGGTSGDRASTKQSEAYFSKRADGKIIIKWKSPEQQADPSLAAYADTTKDDRRRQPEFARTMRAKDDPTGWLGERTDGPAQAFDGFDYVLRCTGWRMQTDIYDEALAPVIWAGNKYPKMTEAWGHVNVPGLYYAGTLMHGNDFRKSAGGFIHGFRYLVRAQHRILELRNHGVQWPSSEVMHLDSKSRDGIEPLFQLGQRLLPRVSEMSGPYQMFNVLFDVCVLSCYADSGEPVVLRFEEVPKYFVPELMRSVQVAISQNATLVSEKNRPLLGQYWTVGFEYGKDYGGYDDDGHVRDTLRSSRTVRPFDEADPNGPGAGSLFLHPVFRYNCYDEATCDNSTASAPSTFHLGEDIHTTWNRAFDNEPLSAMFLQKHVRWTWGK